MGQILIALGIFNTQLNWINSILYFEEHQVLAKAVCSCMIVLGCPEQSRPRGFTCLWAEAYGGRSGGAAGQVQLEKQLRTEASS